MVKISDIHPKNHFITKYEKKMKNKTNKNAKMNKIFGCGKTAMKLGTGGKKGLLLTARKTPFQPNHHCLADDDILLARRAYDRHL